MCSRRCPTWPAVRTGASRPSPIGKRSHRALEATLLPGLTGALATSRVATPLDFQDRLNSFRGAGFSLEPMLTQSAWFRPHNASEDVRNLFLVGRRHPSGRRSAGRALLRARSRQGGAPCLCFRLTRRWPAASDYAACRAAIRLGSRSFYAASRLLPAVRSASGLRTLCVLPHVGRCDRPRRRLRSVARDHLRERLAARE